MSDTCLVCSAWISPASTHNCEDVLTYRYQAEGPDEFPEGYFRSIARELIKKRRQDNE